MFTTIYNHFFYVIMSIEYLDAPRSCFFQQTGLFMTGKKKNSIEQSKEKNISFKFLK